MTEDRIVTTDQLRSLGEQASPWLQLGPGRLSQLDPLGMHVLVPRAELPWEPGVLVCDARLRTQHGDERAPVLVATELFESLPTAFDALGVAAALAAGIAAEVEAWPHEA